MTRSVDLTAYDEDTMTRVRGVMESYLGEDHRVTDVINTLQNIGILFRELPYDEERKPLSTPSASTVEIREKAIAVAQELYPTGTTTEILVKSARVIEEYLSGTQKG